MSLLKPSKKKDRKRIRCAQHNSAIKESLKKDLGPIVNKIRLPVAGAAKKHPKRTFAIMIAIIIANMALLFFFTDDLNFENNHKGFDFNFSEIIPKFKDPLPQNQVDFSWKNFWTVKKIKDSMEYIMNKKHLSRQDTLLFIRLSERFSKVDNGYHPIYNKQLPKP